MDGSPFHLVRVAFHLGHIECVHTCDQESYLFIETKYSICIKKEFNSHRINLLLQYGELFIVHSSNMADMTSCHDVNTLYRPNPFNNFVVVVALVTY